MADNASTRHIIIPGLEFQPAEYLRTIPPKACAGGRDEVVTGAIAKSPPTGAHHGFINCIPLMRSMVLWEAVVADGYA